MDGKWLTYSGRALALLWALSWMLFGMVLAIGQGSGPLGVAIHTVLPGLIFLAAAVMAWRWRPWGTIPLIVLGVWTLIAYEYARTGEGFLTVSLPPVAGGSLLLAGWWAGLKAGAPWGL